MDQRKALLEAAIACLQERGYARTTTRDIVTAAGSHLPAVNYYFGSKEQLLHEAIVEALHRWTQSTMVGARPPAPGTPRERLRLALEHFFSSLEPDRPYVVAAVEAFAQAARSDALRERLAGAYQDARHEVAQNVAAAAGEQDGVPDTSEVENAGVASVLLALFDGLAIQWLMDPQRAPTTDEVMRSLDLIAAAFTGGPER